MNIGGDATIGTMYGGSRYSGNVMLKEIVLCSAKTYSLRLLIVVILYHIA